MGAAAGALVAAGCQKQEAAKAPPAPAPVAAAMIQASAACDGPTTPFCNTDVTPPPGWTGPLFKLSQDYPAVAPKDAQPWLAFDPKTQPGPYLRAALAYFYEGNVRPDVERSFDPSLNTVRHWYNAPWQDTGFNGREPLHGLTRERVSLPGELAATQKSLWNNYAVGFYNAPGGVALGKIWANHGKPDIAAAGQMPEGTVAAKLLFTTAGAAEVPYLAGSPTWSAYVYSDPNDPLAATTCGGPKPKSKPLTRAVLPVHLLQIDIAVKDHRAGRTGWIFGTFVYGGGPGGPAGSGWTNVAPVGVMWGNDPGYAGPPALLKETWLNPGVHMPHVGWQSRLDGPVDNPSSSCMSCHMTGEAPMFPNGRPMVPACNSAPSTWGPWFQDLADGQPFDPGHQSTDDSLQVAVGLANFAKGQTARAAPTVAAKTLALRALQATPTDSPRDGGPPE